MEPPTLTEFEAAARRDGYDEVAQRVWPANAEVGSHEHPFSVNALVVAGEMWLTHGGATRHFAAGDRFELARAVPHAERYGAEGATVWAARRYAGD